MGRSAPSLFVPLRARHGIEVAVPAERGAMWQEVRGKGAKFPMEERNGKLKQKGRLREPGLVVLIRLALNIVGTRTGSSAEV
jgi:hypothetical protein